MMAVVAIASLAAAGAAMLGFVVAMLFRWGSQRHADRLTRLSRVELAEMFLFVEPARFLRYNALALISLPPLAFVAAGGVVALIVAAVVLTAPVALYRRLRERRNRALQRQLADVAAAIATALRAGLGLAQALEQVVRHQPRPSAQEFALALREHRLGTPLEQALSDLARRVRSADYDMLVATLGIARELGGGLAEALDRLAVAVRRRVAMEDRIAALTAQGRLQGLIMAILPVLLGLVLYAMQPQAMQPLFETPLGWATLAVVAALEIGGWMLIRRIVAIRV